MAQLVVSAAGAVAGFMIGGPAGAQAGWMLASTAYGMLNPTKTAGPRLSDLKVSGTEYGQCIPYCFGHPRLAGQIIYASQKYEIANTQSAGKGGGQEYTSYTYEVDLLYLLTDNEMQGVSRIWLNGELVWGNLEDPTNPDLTLSNIIASINSEKWQRMTVYTGAADQLPDPDYEAAVTNAPAYRGRTTVFFKRLKLGNSGQIPQLTFEVYDAGVVGAREVVFLLRGDDGFTEEINNEALIPSGTIVASTSIGPFGNGAFIFGDSYGSHNYLYSTSHSSLDLEQEDFCIEGWIYVEAGSYPTGASSLVRIFRTDDNGTDAGIWVNNDGTGNQRLQGTSPSGGRSGPVIPKGVWNHVALTRTGGKNYSLLMNGSLQVSWVDTYWRAGGTRFVRVGIDQAALPLYTVAAGVRITKGSQVYTDGYEVPTALPQKIGNSVTLSNRDLRSVVESICARAGMPAGGYDASALASITKPVRSIAISQVGAPRATLEDLMRSHYFGAYTTDKLYFVPRGGSSVATIPFGDLGAYTSSPGEPLALHWGNELELPATVSISYANVDGDYNTATEESDRLLTSQGSTSAVTLAMGMTSAEAKGVANTAVADSVASLLTSTISIPSSYSRLTPTDVVTLKDKDGSSYRVRINKRTDSDGLLTLEVVGDDAQALQSVGISSTDYTPSATVASPVDTVLAAIDAPILRDADDAPGYYLAAKGSSKPWPGCAAYASSNGSDYTLIAQVLASSVIGVTTTTLADWAGIGMDTANTVTVDVGAGQLNSATRDALFAADSVNALWFSTGEIIRFQTATLVSAGVYTLSGLLRGQRGTEQFIGAHASGETVVLLTSAGLRRVTTQTAEIGQARTLKGVTLNRALSTATGQSFTNSDRAQKPFAPVDARAVRAANGDVTLSWKPRTRYATSFCGPAGINVPMSDPDNYRVEIRNAGGVTLRTINVTGARSTTYAIADQISDWGTAPTTLYVRISQVNSVVGAGYGLTATIPCALISAGAGAEFGMRPLLESGGITTAGGLLSTLRSTDGGHTFTKATASVPSHLGGYIEPGVSVLGTQYFAPAYHLGTGYAGMIVGNTDPSTTPTRYDPTTPLDITTGYPRTSGGATILPGAVWSDGSYHYAVGRQADNTTNDGKLYLYRADSSLSFTLLGEMTVNGSDPNAIAASTYGGWHAAWFAPYRVALGSQLTSKLFKVGARWFLVGAYAAYYSDDSAGLTGWTRCPTGLGEGATNPPISLVGMVACGSYLVAVRTNNLGTCIAVSSDNGSTWSASRPAALVDFDAPLGVATDGTSVFVYFTRGTTTPLQYVLSATGTLTSWSAASCGLGAGQVLDGQASILATSTGIAATVNAALVWADDGITFISPSIT